MRRTCAIMLFLLCCSGCNLFKSTTKKNATNTVTSASLAASSQLILRSANKETHVYTYWNDSSIYQYQLIKEQANESRTDKVKIEAQHQAKQQQSIKVSKPAKVWVYFGITLAIIVLYLLYRCFKGFTHLKR